MKTSDTSIQANLRRQALNKKDSHRNWREWYAIWDYEVEQKELYAKQLGELRKNTWYLIGAGISFGVAIGLCLAVLIIQYVW